MKRRKQRNSPGSANSSVRSLSCNLPNDKSSSSIPNSQSNISKYFTIETPTNKREETSEIESPYKNIVTELKPFMNNSVDDDNDFKSPANLKQSSLKANLNQNAKKRSYKQRKNKTKNLKGQIKLTKMMTKELECSGMYLEHLETALALSKSEMDEAKQEQSVEESDNNCYPSTQGKLLSMRKTLEQYGFKSNKEIKRNKQVTKHKKKSKYQFITPILFIRTEEERQNLITTKISTVLSQSSLPKYMYEKQQPIIWCKHLCDIYNESSNLFNLNNCENLSDNAFYVSGLNIERNTAKCGYLLKDWSTIPGREPSPVRIMQRNGTKETCRNTNSDVKGTNEVQNEKKEEDSQNSESNKRNSVKDSNGNGSMSPDLFSSDGEIYELEESIRERLETSLCLIESMKASREESFNVGSNRMIDKTEDSLPTLQITLTEDVKTPNCKNFNIFSASLLSNFDSLKKHNKHDMEQSNCDSFNHDVTLTNINGVECFESFYEENAKMKEFSICDLTASDDEEKKDLVCPWNKLNTDSSLENEGHLESNLNFNGEHYLTKSDQENFGNELQHNHVTEDSKPSNFDDKMCSMEEKPNYEVLSDSDLDNSRNNHDDDHYDIKLQTSSCISSNSNHKETVAKSKYEVSSDSDLDEDQQLNDINIKALLEDVIIYECTTDLNSTKCSKRSQSGTINHSDTATALRKTCSTPVSKEVSLLQRRLSSSSNSYENSNEVICISDEELNYSSVHSTPSQKPCKIANRSVDFLNKHEDIDNYSYLEKYYDQHLYTENFNDSPIRHHRITELKENTPQTIFSNIMGMEKPSNQPNIIIKTKNVTPMPDYGKMDSPEIARELGKIGVKQLKRQRGVQVLKHVYETTHPLYSDGDHDGNVSVKRPKVTKLKSKRRLQIDADNIVSTNINGVGDVEIVGDIFGSENLIFERKRSKRVLSCDLPLHIAWHNLVSSNSELKENILLYEPLQLEVLYSMLKEQGHNFHIQDLLTFLDRKCITVRTNQNNRSSKHRY